MKFDELPRQGQAKPGAFDFLGRRPDLFELFEDRFLIFERDADARITHRHFDGTILWHRPDFDLPTAIENALMLVRERAGRRSIALHTNIDNRLGQVQADERKVRQVVLNLLSNAIKFTPEGGRIEVGAMSKDGSVEISVSDTGIGIAPDDQEKVFEEFRQVGTAAKKIEGTGLGLTLCRKFVELHGGRIWVKSQEGVGSTFTFTIPIRYGE